MEMSEQSAPDTLGPPQGQVQRQAKGQGHTRSKAKPPSDQDSPSGREFLVPK